MRLICPHLRRASIAFSCGLVPRPWLTPREEAGKRIRHRDRNHCGGTKDHNNFRSNDSRKAKFGICHIPDGTQLYAPELVAPTRCPQKLFSRNMRQIRLFTPTLLKLSARLTSCSNRSLGQNGIANRPILQTSRKVGQTVLGMSIITPLGTPPWTSNAF